MANLKLSPDGSPFSGVEKAKTPCRNCGKEIYWNYSSGYYTQDGPRNADASKHICYKKSNEGDSPKPYPQPDGDYEGMTREQLIDKLEREGHARKDLLDKSIRELVKMLSKSMPEESEESKQQRQAEAEKLKQLQQQKEDEQRQRSDEHLHNQTYVLLTALHAGMHVALKGPAGSFKTTMAKLVAEALNLKFDAQSFCNQTSEAKLVGFVTATGDIVMTPFRNRFIDGGIFLGDEFDAANPNIGVVLNSASANGMCSFPDGTFYAHPTFRLILAMNTVGAGADRKYVGRNQLDAATRDRYAVINWDYDIGLETKMARILNSGESFEHTQKKAILRMTEIIKNKPLAEINVDAWTNYCHALRLKSVDLGLADRNVIASPRAIFGGIKLLKHNLFVEDVAKILIFNKLSDEDAKLLSESVKTPTNVFK